MTKYFVSLKDGKVTGIHVNAVPEGVVADEIVEIPPNKVSEFQNQFDWFNFFNNNRFLNDFDIESLFQEKKKKVLNSIEELSNKALNSIEEFGQNLQKKLSKQLKDIANVIEPSVCQDDASYNTQVVVGEYIVHNGDKVICNYKPKFQIIPGTLKGEIIFGNRTTQNFSINDNNSKSFSIVHPAYALNVIDGFSSPEEFILIWSEKPGIHQVKINYEYQVGSQKS
jgi:translation elongation factor EF-G